MPSRPFSSSDHVAFDPAGADDGDLDGEIVERAGFEARQHVDLCPAFHLEDADAVAPAGSESINITAGRIKPGTRLVRDWGRTSHHVTVLERGYLYRDRHYRSLSQIAREITGAHWSGPRFFGLSRKASGNG